MFKSIPVYIRPAALIFAGVIAVVVSAIVTSVIYRNNSEQSEYSAKRAMYIWKSKIDGSRQSDRIVDRYESDYLKLVKKDIIGNENRLSWFETIRHVSDMRDMPSVKYSVFTQKKVQTPTLRQKYSGLTLYDTAMTLDMVMGHEGDLFAMLNGLQDRARGLFTVDKCSLELNRPQDAPANSVAINHMKARCALSWYTIKAAQ